MSTEATRAVPGKESKHLSPVASIVRKRSLAVPIIVIVIIAVAVAVLYTVSVRERSLDLLATVNGEPIYAADVEDALQLLPEQFHTDESRSEILEQTIDLVLLKQEATRRGIVITDAQVENAISELVNASGRSPQELRLLLADRNLTLDDYRRFIKDSLVAQELVEQAITNRVTVTEQEIVAYYNEHRSDLAPPRGGARISHILVRDEATARDVIAALNRGERFIDLVRQYSIDAATRDAGGDVGFVVPGDARPQAFIDASLSLLENQYTLVPVQTDAGYHVILRGFNLPDLQEVRLSIQRRIILEKQQAAFTSLLAGLRADATIRYYTENGVVSASAVRSLDGFAACVGRSATVYGEQWSESLQEQLALFGPSTSLLNVVDCTTFPAACNDAGIQRSPTWIIAGERYGRLSLSELAQRTGCALPS